MGKILLLVLLAFVAYAFWRSAQARKIRARMRESGAAAQGARAEGGNAGASAAGERMVRCERCGVHLPMGEAVQIGERHYCSPEHAGIEKR